MEEKNVSKLEEGVKVNFKAEKIHVDLLNDYIDENGFNKSAILRRMLVDFLKRKGVY